jgi:uncharacterized membrane protein (DUF106 family)
MNTLGELEKKAAVLKALRKKLANESNMKKIERLRERERELRQQIKIMGLSVKLDF